VVVTNYVLAETLGLTRERLGAGAATAMLDRLIQGAHFDVVHATRAEFTAAQALFREDDDLSFVDATIAVSMDRTNVEFRYSFDGVFDALDGVTRLATDENPFARSNRFGRIGTVPFQVRFDGRRRRGVGRDRPSQPSSPFRLRFRRKLPVRFSPPPSARYYRPTPPRSTVSSGGSSRRRRRIPRRELAGTQPVWERYATYNNGIQ
jgi:predicted nucleic acid-binding protein